MSLYTDDKPDTDWSENDNEFIIFFDLDPAEILSTGPCRLPLMAVMLETPSLVDRDVNFFIVCSKLCTF